MDINDYTEAWQLHDTVTTAVNACGYDVWNFYTIFQRLTQQMRHGVTKIAAVLLLGTLTLASCYSVMPINDAKTAKENKSTAKTVIAYYDTSIGTDAIENFIKKNDIEVLYRYDNIKGYALKLKDDKQRKALEKTKGVLSVQDDQVMQTQ